MEGTRLKRKFRNIFFWLSIIGPGIITANVDNDAGGITTYSLAGTVYGYSLLWTLIPITFALIVVQEMVARMGVVTQKGLADLIREKFGVKTTFYLMVGVLIANLANTVGEFAGVAAAGEVFGIPKFITVPLSALLVWWLVVKGTYRTVEKVFLTACIFYVSYIISGVMEKPPWADILRTTITPSFSFHPSYIAMVIGVIGTTIAPWMQFYLQSSIVEKGIKVDNYKYSRLDVSEAALQPISLPGLLSSPVLLPYSGIIFRLRRQKTLRLLLDLWRASMHPLFLHSVCSTLLYLLHPFCRCPRPIPSAKEWGGNRV